MNRNTAAPGKLAAPPPPEKGTERGSLKSMHKLMAVLDCFSRFDRSLTLSEISARCGMPKTTVHRLVSSLREVKLLEQDRGRDNYRMGIRLFELGSIVLGHLDIYREAQPLVDRLINATGAGSHLCVFDGTNMVSIEHLEPGASSVNWTTTLSISPSYCTGVGKAVLAFQEPAVIDKIVAGGLVPYTPNTIVDPDALRRELALTARARLLDRRGRAPAEGALRRRSDLQRGRPRLRRRQRHQQQGAPAARPRADHRRPRRRDGRPDFAAAGLRPPLLKQVAPTRAAT